MQGGEGWKTPEESWMDMDEGGDKVYFVNVLLKDKVDSDEEMEREIEETEAAVEASISRRAKRAGVELTVTKEGRMSEANRECFHEEVGDDPGVRAKRRKEIEGMSEEEIEAEIRKSEVAIAERVGTVASAKRRRGPDTGDYPGC
jgi:hypothetical protein